MMELVSIDSQLKLQTASEIQHLSWNNRNLHLQTQFVRQQLLFSLFLFFYRIAFSNLLIPKSAMM